MSEHPNVENTRCGSHRVWEPQEVSLSSPSLRPPRWVGNGGPSLVWEPRGGSSPHYWPPTQVGRQWWAIPGLSYTAGTSIPEVTWAPATLLLNQLRL